MGEWLTVEQAATNLGLSSSGFRAIGTTEGPRGSTGLLAGR